MLDYRSDNDNDNDNLFMVFLVALSLTGLYLKRIVRIKLKGEIFGKYRDKTIKIRYIFPQNCIGRALSIKPPMVVLNKTKWRWVPSSKNILIYA